MQKTGIRIRFCLAAIATIIIICFVEPAGAVTKTDYLSNLRAAAEKGNHEAQHELGNNYLVGSGVHRDNAAAVKWYRLAAEQGNAEAQAALGMMYSTGAGVPKDNQEALKWWVKAAEQHNADAQDQIGFAYLLGDGVPRNHTHAYMWFTLAARNGDKHAVKDIESLTPFMVKEQIDEAIKLADEWMEKHPRKTDGAVIKTATR